MACLSCARRRAKLIAVPLHTAGVTLETIVETLEKLTNYKYVVQGDMLYMVAEPPQRII